jgi:hypothetical protein
VPFAAQASTLKQLATVPSEGHVVDCTVPLATAVGGRRSRLLGVRQCSAAEQAASCCRPVYGSCPVFTRSAPPISPNANIRSTRTC